MSNDFLKGLKAAKETLEGLEAANDTAELLNETTKKNNEMKNAEYEPAAPSSEPTAETQENKEEKPSSEQKEPNQDIKTKEKEKATQLEEVGTQSYAQGMMAAINNLGKQEWIYNRHEGNMLGVPGKVAEAVKDAPSNIAGGYRYMRDVGAPKISEATQGAATAIGNKVSEAASKVKNFTDGLALELMPLSKTKSLEITDTGRKVNVLENSPEDNNQKSTYVPRNNTP